MQLKQTAFKQASKIIIPLVLIILSACSTLVQTDKNGLQENEKSAITSPYVIMISIDGFRHDYIEMYNPPFLSSIAKDGFRAKRLIPVFPSKTFPNHYSLVTGMYAGNHGLVANSFIDPELDCAYQIGNAETTTDGKWYGGSPLWLSVRNQGMMSSSFFWVGSDANIKGHYPNYYVPYDGSVPNGKRVDQVVSWLKLPKEKRPHYLTLYFSDVDSAGHRFGPDSEEVKKAVLDIDNQIGRLHQEVLKLDLPVNFVIVSDHGMKAIEVSKKIYLKKYIDTSKAEFKERGPITLIYMKDKNDLDSYYKQLSKVPLTKIYKREELPKRYHYNNKRAGDLILLADSGAYIYPNKDAPKESPQKGKEEEKLYSGGTHGYDPQVIEMSGILLAKGPGIAKTGLIPAIENIHVYPFVMKLLGLEVIEKIDGNEKVLGPYLIKN